MSKYHDLGPGPRQEDTVGHAIAYGEAVSKAQRESLEGILSGYYVVTLKKPLPGILATTFVFLNHNEADEFASCIHARFEDAETMMEPAGTPQSVFENWSF